MVQFRHPLFRRPHAIHYLALPWRKPRDDATCLHRFPPELHPSFEAQTQKPSTSGFEAQTTNLPEEAYPLRLLRPLDMCHRRPRRPLTKSSSAPLDLVNRRLDMVNTVTPHVLLHLSMTQVLATHGQSPRFSSPSVKAPASVLER